MLVLEHEQLETMERQMFEALRRWLPGADMALESPEIPEAAKLAVIEAHFAAFNGYPALSLVARQET